MRHVVPSVSSTVSLGGLATCHCVQHRIRKSMSAIFARPPTFSVTSQRARKALSFACMLIVTCLVIGIGRSGAYTANSPLGYWMGVVGGSLMLLLLLYPLSKRARALRELMPLRYWFALHMFLGIFGPVLVLLHSTLRLHSLNATVAFWSMVIVASKIGRASCRERVCQYV